MALSIALLSAFSGGWWLVQQATQGSLPDVASVTAIEGDLELGAQVSRTAGCTSCHGDEGFGAIGPNLRNARFAYRNTPKTIAQRVRAGKGIMPSFSPDRITDKELAGLVVFIRNWYSP